MNKAEIVLVSKEVEGTPETVTAKVDKKKQEKIDKQRRDYANSMISRAEAFSMSQELAKGEVQAFSEFVREPLHVNLVQTMALVDIMMAKGLFTEEEFQTSLENVSKKLQEQGDEPIVGEDSGTGEEKAH